MQDYYDNDFSVSMEEVQQIIIEAFNNGFIPLLYINGFYYDIKIGDNKQ